MFDLQHAGVAITAAYRWPEADVVCRKLSSLTCLNSIGIISLKPCKSIERAVLSLFGTSKN